MARYIDADALIEALQNEYDKEGAKAYDMAIKGVADASVTYSHGQFCYLNAMERAKDMPAADVVPKSEVDRLQAEVKVLTENSITSKYPCCVSCSNGLILTKSLEEYDKLLADIANEVAREIFGEIERLLDLNSFQGDIFTGKYFDVELATDIAELKQKYEVGEQHDN